MPKFGKSDYVLYQQNKNNFSVFLCVIVYRLFILNFWWCILRNIVNISQSPSQQCLVFLTRIIFTMSVFPLCYAPLCPRKWGGAQCKFGGTLKKIFRRFVPEFVPPNFKIVSAPILVSVLLCLLGQGYKTKGVEHCSDTGGHPRVVPQQTRVRRETARGTQAAA